MTKYIRYKDMPWVIKAQLCKGQGYGCCPTTMCLYWIDERHGFWEKCRIIQPALWKPWGIDHLCNVIEKCVTDAYNKGLVDYGRVY